MNFRSVSLVSRKHVADLAKSFPLPAAAHPGGLSPPQLPRPHGQFILSPTETTKPCKMLQSRPRGGLISLTDRCFGPIPPNQGLRFYARFPAQGTVQAPVLGGVERQEGLGSRGRRVFCTWGEIPAPAARVFWARRFPATAAFLLGRRKRYTGGRLCVAGPEQPLLANFLAPGFPQENPSCLSLCSHRRSKLSEAETQKPFPLLSGLGSPLFHTGSRAPQVPARWRPGAWKDPLQSPAPAGRWAWPPDLLQI